MRRPRALFRHMVNKALLMLASQPSWDLPLESPFETAAAPVSPSCRDLSKLCMLTKTHRSANLTQANNQQQQQLSASYYTMSSHHCNLPQAQIDFIIGGRNISFNGKTINWFQNEGLKKWADLTKLSHLGLKGLIKHADSAKKQARNSCPDSWSP